MTTIEKPKIEDVRGIQEVFYKTWLATYPDEEAGITVADIEEKYKDRFSEAVLEKRRNDILDKSENKLFLVAKDDGQVVGACRARKDEKCNELEAIYVLPDYQGKGIGKMLWDRAMEFFENEKDIIVQVVTYNLPAINFYRKLGFTDTGKRFSDEKFKMPISGSYLPEMEMVIRNKK